MFALCPFKGVRQAQGQRRDLMKNETINRILPVHVIVADSHCYQKALCMKVLREVWPVQRGLRGISRVAKFGLIFLGLYLTQNAYACETSVLSYPALGSQISELQPELKWPRGAPGPYRVQLAAILPEARVVMSLDSMTTENTFRLPSAIPSNFAAIKVLVSQNCKQFDVQDLNARGPSFFVDTRADCSLSSNAIEQKKGFLLWAPIKSADSYVVRFFQLSAEADGLVQSRLLLSAQTGNAQWSLPLETRAGQMHIRVATVQAVCNGASGPMVQLSLKP